jgi:hypothetical protein
MFETNHSYLKCQESADYAAATHSSANSILEKVVVHLHQKMSELFQPYRAPK